MTGDGLDTVVAAVARHKFGIKEVATLAALGGLAWGNLTARLTNIETRLANIEANQSRQPHQSATDGWTVTVDDTTKGVRYVHSLSGRQR